jgi:hypothetical protein
MAVFRVAHAAKVFLALALALAFPVAETLALVDLALPRLAVLSFIISIAIVCGTIALV